MHVLALASLHACRFIGVTKVHLYVDDGEPMPESDALKNYSGKFLRWRTLSERDADEDESQFIRRKCISQNTEQHAYITFLRTHDYIMPRGAGKNKRGQLSVLLAIDEFRYGPGVKMSLLRLRAP